MRSGGRGAALSIGPPRLLRGSPYLLRSGSREPPMEPTEVATSCSYISCSSPADSSPLEPHLLPPQPFPPHRLPHDLQHTLHLSPIDSRRLEVELDLLTISAPQSTSQPNSRTFGSVPLVLTVPTTSTPSRASPSANEIICVVGSTGKLGTNVGGLDES